MPRYSYKCKKCGEVIDCYSSIATRNDPIKCFCGGTAARDVEVELNSAGAFDETTKEHIRFSSSMGVNPRQIPEAMKVYPGSEYTADGRLIINSRKDKLKKMKERGFVEFE